MSEHIIHLYGVFNNTINEIPTRGDNAGCSCNIILKTSIILGVNKFLIGIIYILIFIPSPTKLQGDIVTLPSVRHNPCEHSRINILQWILTKLGTYLVLKRIWNPIDCQGHRVKFLPHNILVNTLESTSFNGF